MNFYKLDYAIEKTLELDDTLEQKFLLDLTGKKFDSSEAEGLWRRVIDHKWYISERLGRDVGLRVAAVDFIENIYTSPRSNNEPGKFSGILPKIARTLSGAIRPPASRAL